MSGIDDVLNEIDALRLRHVDSLRKCFGKTADDPMPTKDMVQRVLICDAAEGETVTTDYGALIKLLKTNIKKSAAFTKQSPDVCFNYDDLCRFINNNLKHKFQF